MHISLFSMEKQVEDIKIFKLNYETYLLFLADDDIYFYREEIYNQLSSLLGKKFSIMVDMFLRNGFTFNRFVELTFDENGQFKSRIVNPRDVPDELKENTKQFLKKNVLYLEESPISNIAKEFILA